MALFESKKKVNQKKLDSAMLAINSMLNEIYSNKSSDEYKMKGDITKSPSYSKIEEMIADLKTLKGYPQNESADITKMFNTLHRPIFKTMVKEYIMEHNDKNTVFTATFTVGYRLLVGELTRIFASTIATDKGIVYKPNKVQKKSDASEMIKIYNDQLEDRLNKYIKDAKAYPQESPVSESMLVMMVEKMYQESTEDTNEDATPIKESDDDANVNVDPEDDTNGDAEPVQEASKIASGLAALAKGSSTAAAAITGFGKDLTVVAISVGIIAGLFKGINSIFKGFNPIADINYLFMNSYDKKIDALGNVSKMYEETKKAYEEYMKLPETQRNKKVEAKYIQNMEKYNISMQNLAAQIEHFNQRAKKESGEVVNDIENKLPSGNVNASSEGGSQGSSQQDDDFQF